MHRCSAAVLLTVAALAAVATSPAALAQGFPGRPVKLVVPFPPGGGSDLVGRIFAQELGKLWQQNVVVDNRPGAGGMIGTDAVAKSAPDGYTLLHATMAATAVAPSVYAKVPYDPDRDFVYVGPFVRQPSVLLANPRTPANNVKELVDWIRANKGKVSYSSPGVGLSGHLGMEMILRATGVEALHVPYKGAAPASQAMAAGETDLTLDLLPTAVPYVRGNKARAYAVTSETRSGSLPEVPTFAEAGFPGLAVYTWQGLAVPAGTPSEVVSKLARDLQTVRALPEVKDRFQKLGAETFEMTPEAFTQYVRSERRRWADVSKQAGVTPQQ